MQDSNDNSVVLAAHSLPAEGSLWPSAEYQQQLAVLRNSLGETVYLVVLNRSDIHLSVTLENRPVRLLDIIDFPAPDPALQRYPHMLILDDGRGVNLGQVLRVAKGQAFAPDETQILFQQHTLIRQLLYQERRLSEKTIAETSRHLLAALLGAKQAPSLPDKE